MSSTNFKTLIVFLFSLAIQSASFAQKEESELMLSHENAFRSILELDSLLYFESLTEDFKLIRSNGQEVDLMQLWEMAHKMHRNNEGVFEITSTRINGNVAWMTYRYRFQSLEDEGSEPIRYVDSLSNYRWIETSIFVKVDNQWKMTLSQYVDAPDK